MSVGFAAARGRRMVSRRSAEGLGELAHIVVDAAHQQIVWLVIGKGRKALLVDFDDVSGFGPDAVMIVDESALRTPRDDREQDAADGKLELLGRRALSDTGNDLGTVTDVVFDPVSGTIEALIIGEDERPGASLLGAGSYAVVVRAPAD
jgi:uncharacterized protein YrrD